MPVRLRGPVCFFCAPQAGVTAARQRVQCTSKSNLHAVALPQQETEQAFFRSEDGCIERKKLGRRFGKTLALALKQWESDGPTQSIRDKFEELEAMAKTRTMRLELLKKISDPSASIHGSLFHHDLSKLPKPQVPKADLVPIPHATFRTNLRQARETIAMRTVLREQLLRVQCPKDILRIVALAMQNRAHAKLLNNYFELIMRAAFRCRRTATDSEISRVLTIVITRLDMAGFDIHHAMIAFALKFAARTRSLRGMKKYLRLFRERQIPFNCKLFRAVVAKCSIGRHGLGEIRNGRWRRADLLQVLIGFDDCKHLPPERQYHFGTFLNRSDWQYLHGWVAVLARCRASDVVWQEWELWKENPARVYPKRLRHQVVKTTSRFRGDYWFVEQMTCSGDLRLAWRILEESVVPFSALKTSIQMRLLDAVENASVWTPQLTDAMLRKYDHELARIEEAFGVAWQPGIDGSEGQHVLFRDQEEAMDELGSDDWKAEEDYGYPYEGDSMLSSQERSLHDAEEGALA